VSVLVVGDVATDILAVHSGPLAVGSDIAARISLTGGGSAANTAAWLASLGIPVTLVGVVGADEAGAALLAELAQSGVRCAVRRSGREPTGSVVVLSTGAERTMLSDRGANGLLRVPDVATVLDGATHQHVHVSGYTLFDARTADAGRYALAWASARGLTASVDAASAAPLRRLGAAAFLSRVRGADLLLANVDEAAVLADADGPAEELAGRLTGRVRRVVVKRGADGAVWADADGGRAAASALPATAVDPTGAGDAFAAGLLAAWLGGADPGAALAAGTRLGASAVGVIGGRPRAG
jgi:sugar/nucleoside kinase (ribokinase family)